MGICFLVRNTKLPSVATDPRSPSGSNTICDRFGSMNVDMQSLSFFTDRSSYPCAAAPQEKSPGEHSGSTA